MQLSLIGMSGSGKTYCSLQLVKLGFSRFCCDDLIAEKLVHELRRADGKTVRLGEWMGFPYELHYRERESSYLASEVAVLTEITRRLEIRGRHTDDDIVVDTTGSVIYTGEEILTRLRRYTTVVHLATPPEIKERMLRKYVANPRPVLWRDKYNKKSEETEEEALRRCYPALLSSRERLYERYADVTIDYYVRSDENFGAPDLLRAIDEARYNNRE